MGSLFKKIKSISKNGIEPLIQGEKNYTLNIHSIEEKAKERAIECSSCINFVDEPIDFLKVKDERINDLNGKMCDECGCALPYLLRQDLKVCKLWKE